MGQFALPIGIVCGIFVALALCIGVYVGQISIMKEAGELGYAMQCKGKTGWYWECEK